ncbi:choice-of-anchor Q domain-containing protein [uncultured Roseovarius sp.]|uniref:choice-of-anchor Q domain-containing protein n=1 Tax=uncultured Roseovarius sp. TaxID=293344 RepID=UPI002610BBDF|nr:choice-of-anchor Q domain-containing protein [uncultured Roseovarius sp.]
MALFIVDNISDIDDDNLGAGQLSLREAIRTAVGGDAILFANSLAGQTITLSSVLQIDKDLLINGFNQITISGGGTTQVFSIIGGLETEVELRGLTLTDGLSASLGGAILSNGTLELFETTVRDSFAFGGGAGIFSSGDLRLVNSLVTGNSANGDGGGIAQDGGSVRAINTTIDGNTAAGFGGGITLSSTANGTFENSTITANIASNGGGGIDDFNAGIITVTNSVVAGNTLVAGATPDDLGSGVVDVARNSFFGTNVTITDATNTILNGGDPLLGALQDNGGPVLTRLPDAGSPLINAGDAALLPADTFDIDGNFNLAEALPADARGQARVQLGALDIGAVERANTPVTGSVTVTVTGAPAQGTALTANASFFDADGQSGLPSFQWFANGTSITSATGASFTPGQAQVGTTISVRVSFTDDRGTLESLTSAATAQVTNVNDAPTGAVVISGDVRQGGFVSANAGGIADADGLGAFSFQWLRDGAPIAGGENGTLQLLQADVGAEISVAVRYTDGFGTEETVTSTPTGLVENVAFTPQGDLMLSGSATQGQTLSVDSSGVSDPDGLGPFSFAWFRENASGFIDSVIEGATGASHVLTQAEVGFTIVASVSYVDGDGDTESVNTRSAVVANVNDAPTGAVTISGTAKQGAVLTANTATITDADGLGTFAFQWLADDTPIAGATGVSFTPGAAQVDAALSVEVRYSDGFGTSESLTSAATAPVEDLGLDLSGTPGADSLVGGDGNEVIRGLGGNDDISGGLGFDSVFGEAGDDTLSGGDGDDALAGADGNDIVNGGSGNDNIGGGQGDDTIDGDDGDDIIGAGFGNDTVMGGNGNDVVAGGAGNDTLSGGEGNDSMSGSFGDDNIIAGGGADDIGGGTGRDTIDAGAGNDRVGGGEGNDSIFGGDGNDFLAGGGRDDVIDGGAGNDTINAGAGNNQITGGAGADQFVFSAFTAGEADVITDFEDGLDRFLIRIVNPETGEVNISNGSNGLAGFVAALGIVDTVAGAQLNVGGQTVLVQSVAAADLTVDDFQFL